MSFGIQIRRTETEDLLTLETVSGRVFLGVYTAEAAVTQVYYFPLVESHTSLFYYTLSAGAHSISLTTESVSGVVQAKLTLTRLYTSTANRINNPPTSLAVFATQTKEVDYGISLVNTSGLRTASTNYPVPVFLQKITFDSTREATYPGVYRHYKAVGGVGRKRLVFYTIPSNPDPVYYFGNSFLESYDTFVEFSVRLGGSPAYAYPEAYVFSLEPQVSLDSYGARVFNASGNVTFDSGLQHLDIIGFGYMYFSESYDTTIGTDETLSVPQNILSTTAILLPEYQEDTAIPTGGGALSSTYTIKKGMTRRTSSTTVVTQLKTVVSYTEDAAWSYFQTYGAITNRLMGIDANRYATQAASPLNVQIADGILEQLTCSYDAATQSSCATTQDLAASVFGGNGNTISYAWSLNATAISNGFNILFGQNNVRVTIGNTSGAGTKTGTATVSVSQSGSTTVYANYSLNHTHTATASNLTGDITPDSGTVISCSYNTGSASSCTNTATYSVTTSGGSGNAKSYSWSLVSNTGGLSISGSTTGTSATVTKTAGAGTYSATLRCTVTQAGAPNSPFIIDESVTFTHVAQTPGNVMSPIPGLTQGDLNVTPSTFTHTDYQEYVSAYSYVQITALPNGQLYLTTPDYPNQIAALTSWWWSGSIVLVPPQSGWEVGVPGIGNNYWIRFTRTAYTGSSFNSTSTTGWLSLSTSRSILVQAATSFPGSQSTTATYKIEIAGDSSGFYIVSTTNGPKLQAIAQSVAT